MEKGQNGSVKESNAVLYSLHRENSIPTVQPDLDSMLVLAAKASRCSPASDATCDIAILGILPPSMKEVNLVASPSSSQRYR